MRIYVILALLYGTHFPGICSPKQLPRDVRVFIANAQACEHLAGEYDGDLPADQKRAIERDVRKYCGAASRQLPVLRTKYRHNPAMLGVITRHANEAVTDYR